MLPSWESLQVAVMMGAARAQDAHQHSYAIKAGRKLPGGSVRSATIGLAEVKGALVSAGALDLHFVAELAFGRG